VGFASGDDLAVNQNHTGVHCSLWRDLVVTLSSFSELANAQLRTHLMSEGMFPLYHAS